jgi:hypothetical protein
VPSITRDSIAQHGPDDVMAALDIFEALFPGQDG